MKTFTKSQVKIQVDYNLKIENMKRKDLGHSKMSKLDRVLYWNDFTDMLHKNNEISDNQFNNWTNPYSYTKPKKPSKSTNFTLDDSYAIQSVYCGYEKPKYQATHCDDLLGFFDTKELAHICCYKHRIEFLESLLPKPSL